MKLNMIDLNTVCQQNVFLSSFGQNQIAELTRLFSYMSGED